MKEIDPHTQRYSYPLSQHQIEQLKAGDTITRFPAERIVALLFQRVPSTTLAEKNTYGEMGGDALQHGNMSAYTEATRDVDVELEVLQVKKDQHTLSVFVTLPTYGNKELWGKSPRKRVVLSFSDLEGPLTKAKRIFSSLLDRSR